MAGKSVQHCNCPRCNAVGRSVGAMNYAETKVWDKSGSFSGSGVGISTGGIGFGVGGGMYSEHGQIASKRAATFQEPQPASFPIGAIVTFLLLSAMAYRFAPSFFEAIAEASGRSVGDTALGANLFQMVQWMAPVAAIVFIGMAVYKVLTTQKEEERINRDVYPKQLARYQQLQYCANCHTIFDAWRNSADANERGFASMMKIDPAQTGIA